jgi:lipopolysaccharide/colanic/teichoic acid biosynthesis glycosyltransferase
MKRIFDIVGAIAGLMLSAPIVLPVMLLVWRQDGHSPLYIADRVGVGGRPFRMVKLRSMIKNADRTGVDSTAANDARITRIGAFIRRYKLDELTQLWNVLIGDMSLVGPRPNVKREVDLYTAAERGLLTVRPGITDYASIVFADEGEILEHCPDPDIAYHQLIRPAKSMLGLFYVAHRSLRHDLWICMATVLALISRPSALRAVERKLSRLGAPASLIDVASRRHALKPMAPPGASAVVNSRDVSVVA